ncbi:MAG: hypothetical protein V7L22_34910 [Nostoc sp.]|uniref:hypothetical protein n=1 Tax=Nostoc sp. TaxID=1180 RepID=UPI002FF8AFB8
MAKSLELSLTDSFTRSLACAAITPGLRSILLFDSSLSAGWQAVPLTKWEWFLHTY